MDSRDVIRHLRDRQNHLSVGEEILDPAGGRPDAITYVQYKRRFDGAVHYEVYRRGNDGVDVRLDDERPNVSEGDELRQRLRQQAGHFIVGGGQNLIIRHNDCVACNGRQFDEIKLDIQSRLADLYNAFEQILVDAETNTHNNNVVPQGVNTMNQRQTLTDRIKQLLESNLQVIVTGAPGTGKTFAARQVAEELVCEGISNGEDKQKVIHDHIQFVQFHPGYDYSDFVIGMKPILVSEDGKEVFRDESGQLYTTYNNDPNGEPKTRFSGVTSVSYAWKDGVFKKFAAKAKKAYDAATDKTQAQKFVLLIDEINRADLSRVFGELFSLLEEDYRYPKNKNGIRLPNGENFVIPENLYIIGTMNDIDRSVESMDFALRRRFAWYEVSAESSVAILEAKGREGKIANDDVAILKNAMTQLNDIIASSSTGKGEKVDGGLGSDKKPDLRLGSAYQLGGAIFAKLEKYVEVANAIPSRAKGDAFTALWNNHIKNILSEYLRGRRDRDDLLKKLETEFKKAILGTTGETESNMSSDGESRSQANSEQTSQA